jgi:50S ribosomal protein L16 3-hydroxylase
MQQLNFPNEITPKSFLKSYWQQKPLLLRQALPKFKCGLDADELAGLACEADVESRLVLERGKTPWEARFGPFTEATFAELPESHWTLLVQDVDKHLPPVASLLDYFHFIPDWRLDDVMVSYAADQGSVGPHIDDYDVFLYQAKGRRRWKIHYQPVSEEDFIPGLDLRILPDFKAEEEWLLEPGDLLYLPPNVAHWGVAEGDDCISCSVGFRAPAYREMANAWCEALGEQLAAEGRYRDLPMTPQQASGEILPTVVEKVSANLQRMLQTDDEFKRRWFGRFISESKPNLQLEPRQTPLSPAAFHERFRQASTIHRNAYSRILFSRGSQGQDSLFVNGEEYQLPSESGDFLAILTHHRLLHFGYLENWLEQPDCLQLVCDLYNGNHLIFDDE